MKITMKIKELKKKYPNTIMCTGDEYLRLQRPISERVLDLEKYIENILNQLK